MQGAKSIIMFIPGHEWEEARAALGRVFAAEQLPEYLTAAKW